MITIHDNSPACEFVTSSYFSTRRTAALSFSCDQCWKKKTSKVYSKKAKKGQSSASSNNCCEDFQNNRSINVFLRVQGPHSIPFSISSTELSWHSFDRHLQLTWDFGVGHHKPASRLKFSLLPGCSQYA